MRFIDVLQIMGIRIADDMAVFQIGMLLFQFMILGHIFDLGTGKLAVRRNEAQVGQHRQQYRDGGGQAIELVQVVEAQGRQGDRVDIRRAAPAHGLAGLQGRCRAARGGAGMAADRGEAFRMTQKDIDEAPQVPHVPPLLPEDKR